MTAGSKLRGEAATRLFWKVRTRKATVIGLALFLSTEFGSAADREMTQEYLTCLDKAGGVTVEMINCILAETKRQDIRLNENYKKPVSKLSTERKKELLEAQRAWINFRDTNCRFYDDPAAGTSARVSANECVLNVTADRAKELRLLTNDQ
jgi:uncharacterized protein YecT (DUF1311 family)